jgi:hypothetical protein
MFTSRESCYRDDKLGRVSTAPRLRRARLMAHTRVDNVSIHPLHATVSILCNFQVTGLGVSWLGKLICLREGQKKEKTCNGFG